MIKYILKRLLISVITIWAIATLCFFLLRLLPGNPFILANPTQMTNAEKMMDYYGLNRPIWQQYLSYLNNLIHLDFGYSLTHLGRSVNQVIVQYFPITAQLGIQALLLGIPLGMVFGIISAVRRGGAIDIGFQVSTVILAAIPAFVLAALLQLVFAVHLKLFPVSQWLSFKHTILPTIAIAIPIICSHTRSMRTLMLEVGKQDYLKTAKAKGVSKFRIVVFHQIRNAVLPLVTNLGLEVAGVLMGSYVVEQVFSIPGLGSYFVSSISGLDYTMTLGLVVFQSVIVVLANFIVDLLYSVIDPRVRIS
ncbi:MAG: ABC transporter permease [Clostridia bacterium]|nr:ABC transporter permease [Clostridia bacterium]